MRLLSVKTCERGIDLDASAQDAREASLGARPLEARDPPAGVGTPPSDRAPWNEAAVDHGEPQQLPLRRAASAARAAPDRLSHYSSS
jgi:hypothetical protein